MSQANSNIVHILMVSIRQDDDSFNTHVDSVYADQATMRERLGEIKRNHTRSDGALQWRVRTPIGEVDKLRVELLIDGIWECQIEYNSVEKELN